MIGVDTNVLVRYLTQDDAGQSAHATRIIEQELSEAEPGFIGLVVLVETAWVLRRLYAATSTEVLDTVSDLLGSRTIVVENREVVARAVSVCETSSCDFADALIVASAMSAGSTRIVTFDRGAAQAGMTLLE